MERFKAWRKSSYSGQPDNNCVELAFDGAKVAIRDSKDCGGGRLTLSGYAFAALTDTAKAGGLEFLG